MLRIFDTQPIFLFKKTIIGLNTILYKNCVGVKSIFKKNLKILKKSVNIFVIIEIIKIKVYKILRIDRLIEKIGNKLNQVLK